MCIENLNPPQLEALKRLAAGETVSATAKAAAVHRSTIYNWCRDHAAFRAALRHSKIQAEEVIDDEIRELASTALDTIRQLLMSDKTSASIKLKAAQYILERAAHPALEAVSEPALAQPESIRQNSTPSTPIRQNSTPRNAPCPCRSGEKYKRCCGKGALPLLYHKAA